MNDCIKKTVISLRELSVELRLYHNLRGVKTIKSASVKHVLLSSATNTSQHTKSKTEPNTEHKMR
jgi:hypothetical protein